MSFDTPSGTYGLPMTGNRLEGWLDRMMAGRLARKVFGRLGFHVLVLTTVGRRTGKERHSQVCWWPAPDGSWYVVAAAGGTRINPAWYHNLAAHRTVSGSTSTDAPSR